MKVQRIKELITGGFKPFIIRMSDDRRYPVRHPEFVAVGKGVVVASGRTMG